MTRVAVCPTNQSLPSSQEGVSVELGTEPSDTLSEPVWEGTFKEKLTFSDPPEVCATNISFPFLYSSHWNLLVRKKKGSEDSSLRVSLFVTHTLWSLPETFHRTLPVSPHRKDFLFTEYYTEFGTGRHTLK